LSLLDHQWSDLPPADGLEHHLSRVGKKTAAGRLAWVQPGWQAQSAVPTKKGRILLNPAFFIA